jgi:ATP-dependent DNA helicase RecG
MISLVSSPEGKTLEFKRDLSSPKSLLKTLVAFANTAGGRLVIGIDDARQIIGVSIALDGEEPRYCLIANRFERAWGPMLTPTIGFILLGLIFEIFKT